MKLVPGQYLNDDLSIPRDFKLEQGDFITLNLRALNLNENELADLFNVTKIALNHWINNTRKISMDKIAVLCNLFGITIDQYYDRDFNNDFHYEDFYGLSLYKNENNFKELSHHHLLYLFEKLNETCGLIECFVRGYVLLDGDYEIYVDCDELSYYCQTLDIDVVYTTKTEKIIKKSIKYDELLYIDKILKDNWGENAYKYIYATPNEKYKRLVMLSENHSFLKDYITKNDNKDDLLKLWIEMKKENNNYDKKYMMIKTLLANNAKLDNEKDMLKLCLYIFENEINYEGGKY